MDFVTETETATATEPVDLVLVVRQASTAERRPVACHTDGLEP